MVGLDVRLEHGHDRRSDRGSAVDVRRSTRSACGSTTASWSCVGSRTGSWRTSSSSFRNGRKIIETSSCSGGHGDRKSGASPLGEADIQPPRRAPLRTQQPHGVVGVHAVRAPAVSHHLHPVAKSVERSRASSSIGTDTAPGTCPARYSAAAARPGAPRCRRPGGAASSAMPTCSTCERSPRYASASTSTSRRARTATSAHRGPEIARPGRSQGGRRRGRPRAGCARGPQRPGRADAARCSRRSGRSPRRSRRRIARPAPARR